MKPIEYLSPYLPSDLRIVVSHRNQSDAIVHLTPAYLGDSTGVKPILRPLSDLPKEIEHNGERFVPIREIAKLYFDHSQTKRKITSYGDVGVVSSAYIIKCCTEDDAKEELYYAIRKDMSTNEHRVVQKLISWHFDVFNLHEEELCVYYDEI